MPMLTGTTAADSLVGTAADDVINARTSPAGSDSLYGGDGADLLYGGAEPGDTNIDAALYGGAGADTLSFEFVSPAGTHSVLLSGGDGADRIVILSSAPLVGSVTVDGGAGDDTLIGSATALAQVTRVNVEHLLVTPADIGDTKIDLTADQIRAMNGSIGIDGSFAAHLFIDITSGSGAIDFTAATTGLDLTAADGLTSITGSRYGDYIHNVVNAAVDGGGGDDNIVALSGTVSGGAGNDTISVVADSPNSRLDGGDGYDRLNLAVDINGASIAIDSLDIASGAPLTALNGGTIRNFEVLSALITRGDGDTITAGTRSTNIETWGDHNVVNASANTSYIYMHGGSGSGNVAHVVPAGVGQQVHLLDAAGVGPDGFVDLNYAAATGSVHFGGDTVLGANQGGVFVQGDVYVGDSSSAASSSATIVGSQIEVTGGAHDDVLQGAPAYFGPREELHGGAGNDTIIAGPTVDLVDAGEGHDTLSFNVQLYQYLGPAYSPAGATIDLAVTGVQATGVGTFSVSGVEDVIGSAGSDALRGDASDNALAGLGGDDALYGGAGNDTLEGGAGDDTLDGGAGLDVAKFGFAHDYALTLNAGSGTMTSTTGTDTISSIETLQFLDGQLSFDTGSTAAQILRLYDSFLGRTPDVEGFNSYLKFFADGHTFQDMADNAAASPEFHDATAQLTDAEYITYVYEHSLHREPEAWGLQQYEAALANGTLTRTSMIVQAAESPEHIALTAPEVAMGLWVPDQAVEGLELLFDGGLYRKPTVAEIATYKAELASGVSFRQIAHELANSSEFQSLHGGQTDAEFINGLYVTELGRNAEPTGLQAYIAELVHGETRGDILYETAFSQTHQNLVLAHYDPLLVSV